MPNVQRSTVPESALVVIDPANDFVFPGGVIADAGVTVVYATDGHQPGDSELTKWPPHSMKGTPQAAIVPALAPKRGDLVIEQRTYSPFVSSDVS